MLTDLHSESVDIRVPRVSLSSDGTMDATGAEERNGNGDDSGAAP